MKRTETVKSKIIFNKIIKEGKKVSNKYFLIFYEEKEDAKPFFGIAVSKKNGNAVIRNKIKRQVRNMIDNNKLLFPKYNNYIIMVKRAYDDLSFAELDKSLKELVRKVNNEK